MTDQWWKIVTFPDTAPVIKELFTKAFMDHGGPGRAAVFEHPSETKPLVTLFFSPKAAEIARPLLDAHQAQECDKPTEADSHVGGKDQDKDMVPRPKKKPRR